MEGGCGQLLGDTYVTRVLRDGGCGARLFFDDFFGGDVFFGCCFDGFEVLCDACQLCCFEFLSQGREFLAERRARGWRWRLGLFEFWFFLRLERTEFWF